VVQLLLRKGADISTVTNDDQLTALDLAFVYGYDDIANMLSSKPKEDVLSNRDWTRTAVYKEFMNIPKDYVGPTIYYGTQSVSHSMLKCPTRRALRIDHHEGD
jgi:ankyrin repeat protein